MLSCSSRPSTVPRHVSSSVGLAHGFNFLALSGFSTGSHIRSRDMPQKPLCPHSSWDCGWRTVPAHGVSVTICRNSCSCYFQFCSEQLVSALRSLLPCHEDPALLCVPMSVLWRDSCELFSRLPIRGHACVQLWLRDQVLHAVPQHCTL